MEVKGYGFSSSVWLKEFNDHIVKRLIAMIEDGGTTLVKPIQITFSRRQNKGQNKVTALYDTENGQRPVDVWVYPIKDGTE